jgi:hypothetical protein
LNERIPQENSPMKRRPRWFQVSILMLATMVAWSQPQTASAWFGRWRGAYYGAGFRPWCGPVYGPRFYGGWGGVGGGWWGGPRFAYGNSVFFGGPYGRFFSGSVSSYVIGPRWCGPAYCGPFGGGFGLPYTYYPSPYGYGCTSYAPLIISPYGGSIAPVYGPAGVLPFMGVSTSAAATRVQSIAATTGSNPPLRIAGPTQQVAAVRPSNGATRLRAARLVAVGDRHLRTAVQTPAKLVAALDAYRRAATIAPDLADTFLRQSIVLTALERTDDAARAIDRAVAIDARLGTDATAALVAKSRLPPDPVFGDRPDSGPTTLASRSTDLIARIFREGPDGDGLAVAEMAGPNWIAARWSQQVGAPQPQDGPEAGPVNAVAAR